MPVLGVAALGGGAESEEEELGLQGKISCAPGQLSLPFCQNH